MLKSIFFKSTSLFLQQQALHMQMYVKDQEDKNDEYWFELLAQI